MSEPGAAGVSLAGPRMVALVLIALGILALVGAAGLEAGGCAPAGDGGRAIAFQVGLSAHPVRAEGLKRCRDTAP